MCICTQEVCENEIRLKFPEAEIVTINSPREFFTESESNDDWVDMLYISAGAGSAWTLLYPAFQVITPFERTSGLGGSATDPSRHA